MTVKLKVAKKDLRGVGGYDHYYINEEGYQVIITKAFTVTAYRDTLFVFSGFYNGGPKDRQSIGYYTEDGYPISFFGSEGYEKHTPLHEPESVADESEEDADKDLNIRDAELIDLTNRLSYLESLVSSQQFTIQSLITNKKDK